MSVTIQLTEKCNLACTYCFQGDKDEKTISLERGKKVLDFVVDNYSLQMAKSGADTSKPLVILFYGGEVLLELPLLKALIQYCDEKADSQGISVNYPIITNGYLLTTEMLDFFEKYREKLFFKVSLDGKESTHNTCRINRLGQGSFDQVIKNAKLLNSLFPSVTVTAITPSENVSQCAENIMYLYAEGFKNIEFDVDLINSQWDDYSFSILEEQWGKLVDFYIEILREDREFNLSSIDSWLKKVRRNSSDYSRCNAGRDNYFVNTEGDIYCCAIANKCTGCLFGTIDHGFNNHVDIVQSIKEDQFAEECRDCAYKLKCNLTCIAFNSIMTKDIFTTSPVKCAYSRLTIELGTRFGNRLYKENPELFMERY